MPQNNENRVLNAHSSEQAENRILNQDKETEKEKQEETQTISEQEQDNVSYLDEDGKIVDFDPCNPEYLDNDLVHPADRAELMESLPLEKQLCMITHMDTEDAAEALAELDESHAKDVIENLDAEDAARILSAMDPDDAVDVLDEVDEDHRDVLLNNLTPEDAMELRALLTFDPDTAAGVMNTEIITVPSDINVDQAIQHIRIELEDKDMPYYVYVVDHLDKLIGIISLRELMLSKQHTPMRDLLSDKKDVITVQFDTDKSEVAKILSHYNFLALPVVDREGHLMGAVTHDDVIDIIQDDASSDLLGMMGAGQDEDINTHGMNPSKSACRGFLSICSIPQSPHISFIYLKELSPKWLFWLFSCPWWQIRREIRGSKPLPS